MGLYHFMQVNHWFNHLIGFSAFHSLPESMTRAYKKRKRRKEPRKINHHIWYKEKNGVDWLVRIWDGEHQILTWMQRRKRVSKGFIVALKQYIKENKKNAVDLEKEVLE